MDGATELAKLFGTLGVGGAIAGIIFWFYRKDVRSYTDLWKIQSEQLFVVVKDNTASNTKLVTLLEALHRRLDDNHFDDYGRDR